MLWCQPKPKQGPIPPKMLAEEISSMLHAAIGLSDPYGALPARDAPRVAAAAVCNAVHADRTDGNGETLELNSASEKGS